MKNILNKNGLTFVELLTASIVTGVVMLGVASMDISLRNAYEGTSKGTMVASKAAALMHHVSRRILEASGSPTDPGVVIASSPSRLYIRSDTPQTPSKYTDDVWHVYQYNSGTKTLSYCTTTNATTNCQATVQSFPNIVLFEPTLLNNSATYQFAISVKITSLYDSSQAVDTLRNPEYTVTSTFNLPSSSSTIP